MEWVVYELRYLGAQQTGKHYQVFDGKWRHLALTMMPIGESSFDMEMYVDGRKETEFLSEINANNYSINTQPSNLVVGGSGYLGWIDDLRIYSTKPKFRRNFHDHGRKDY